MSFSRIKGVFFRYFYALFRGVQGLADLFYWPLVDILLWGLTAIWMQKQQPDSNIPLILMTGLIFWQVTWRGSIDVTVNLLQEFWTRNLSNIFSTPVKITEWALGIVLLCLFKLVITIAFGALTVYILYALNVFTVGWYFLPFAALLLIFGWTVGFLAASFIIYYGHQVEALAWMIAFVFAPFSAVFYPVSILPEWAQVIAWSLPTTYIFEGMRQILAEGIFPSSYFLISLCLSILYLGSSFALFIKMFKKSLDKGLARLE